MSVLPSLVAGLPSVVGVVLLLAAVRGAAERRSGPIAIVASGATAALALWAALARAGPSLSPLEASALGMRIDALAGVMLVTVGLIGFAVVLVAERELAHGRARSLGALLVLLGASLVAAMATSLLTLLIAWEAMALAIWTLLAAPWRERRRVRAAGRAYLFLRAGDIGLYVAAVAAFVGAGTFEIAAAAERLQAPWLHVAAAGLIVSAVMKSAQLPFSIWLDDAFDGGGTVSAALAAALMVVAGGYLAVRTYDILAQAAWPLPTLAVVGGATGLVMGLVAAVQRDLLRALAASSASQKGFIVLAVGVGTLPGAIGFLVAHAFFKALLFASGAVYVRRTGSGDLRSVGAAGALMPRVVAAVSLGALALAGVPPLPGWIVKDEVLAAARATAPALYALGLLAALVSALYAARLLWLVHDRGGREARADAARADGDADAAGPSAAGLALLALGTIAASALLLTGVREGWQGLIGGPAGPHPTPWELALTAALAAAALLLTRRLQRARRLEPPRWPWLPAAGVARLRRWLDMGRAAQALASRVLRMSRLLAGFDRRLERGVHLGDLPGALARFDDRRVGEPIEALGAWGLAVGRRSAGVDEETVDASAERLAAWIGALGRRARRPQTGLLHQYYAQAFGALVVLALVLWLAA